MRDAAVALTAAGIDNVRLEARLLVSKAAGLTIEQLISRGHEPAPAQVVADLRALTARRVQREPLAYILGEREFWGLTFKVSPAVLVPRPESETLVEAALALLPERHRPLRILDLGVGSGCLLLTLLREFPQSTGVGVDASPEALAVARANASNLGVADRVRLVQADWRERGWHGALGGPVDLLVSNPPYIESAAIARLMPEVACFEPRLAVDGGADGLGAYRSIAGVAPRLVTAGGLALLEAGQGQAVVIQSLLSAAGFHALPSRKDLSGIDRIVVAKH